MKCRCIILGAAVAATLVSSAAGQQVSAPVTLQWFESSWQNIERRTADFHAAGYGNLWTPPPGRAVYLPQGGGIGYDPYDRFDLGKPRDPTLYGTERGYKSAIRSIQKTGGNVYVDYVHHHLGSLDMNLNGYTYPQSLINQGAPYLQDRADYPGFEVTDNFNTINSPVSRDTYADFPPGNPNRPFGSVFEYWFRLGENLVTIDLASQTSLNRQFVRNPVPGFNNIRQSPANWAFPTTTLLSNGLVGADTKLRQANVPTDENRRFYPDTNGPSRTVIDGGQSFTVYDFNLANPAAGDPVNENAIGYMMRYAQWLTQVIGVDGLRIDAARHVPLGEFNSGYNPQSLDVPKLIDRAVAGASKRTNLDGTQRSVFQFQEVFNYNSAFLASFIRKPGEQPAGDTVNPNRDVLDFSMWAAMAQNMTGNGLANNWHNIRLASVNASKLGTSDPNVANNGANGIGFVYNHDEGVSPPGLGASIVLDNVAHAWVLMRPGNAYVYYRSDEFNRSNNSSFFLKQGRGDALGGQYGSIITTLVDARNSYGRGNFRERWIDNLGNPSAGSAVYVFEREGSAIVCLNVGYNPGSTQRTVGTTIPNGTWLEEVTGNWQDPSGQVRRYTQVTGGQATVDIPWNNAGNGNKGYAIYGLPLPRGTMSITNLANVAVGTIAPDTQTPATNGTARISAINVITSDQFKIRLNTTAVALDVDNNPSTPAVRDFNADGDVARFRINDGSFDGNGNGVLDYPSSAAANATKYGFENFLTVNSPGFGSANGNGTYEQIVNASQLAEGYHYITTRAWRKQAAGESEVFKDFRTTIYVDRLPPVSSVDSTGQYPYQPDSRSRDIRVKSTDGTADSVHVFLNLGAAVTDSQILAMVGAANKADRIDVDLYGRRFDNVGSGNHVITTVTYEPTGNFSVQRFVGQSTFTSRGLGLGDANFDGGYAPDDVTAFEATLYTQDQQFNPAGDLNADGRVNNLDLFGLPARYASVMASAAFAEANNAVRRRGDFTSNYTQPANAADIDALFANFGPYQWKYDLNVSGGPIDSADVDTMLGVILGTRYGDANLDQTVNISDFALLATNFNQPAGWAGGNFNGDAAVTIGDFSLLAANFNQVGPTAAMLGRASVPEPSAVSWLGALGLLLFRRARSRRPPHDHATTRPDAARPRRVRWRFDPLLAAVATCACGMIATPTATLAQDVSQPATLQWFESRWTTIENRQPDLFMAGYGAMWLPPPGRAEQGDLSVGFDVYDRFDLGSPGRPTLYGTESGLKALTGMAHRAGGVRVHTDLVLNHNGFLDRFSSSFVNSGGYPGFALTLPGDIDGDYHDQFGNTGSILTSRLGYINASNRGLIDIAQEKNYQFIRNPVPGFAGNIPAGTTTFNNRLANVPAESNRRFYPDQQLGGTTYFDPTIGQNVTMYDFNTAAPTAGDPVLENAQTYMMRHARWMIQEIGVDGFRLDAAKHFPPSVLDEFDRYVYRAIKQPLLNGQPQHVYTFSEVLDSDRALNQSYTRKNINPATPNTIGGNRDTLDYPLFFPLRDNLSGTTATNNWANVVNASQDVQDDGLANNGSQGMAFAMSHDNVGIPTLQRVAHAYLLMRPGQALVYFNAREFGAGRTFPYPGRDDALGGFYGDRIKTLVQIRNSHGRGNYLPRFMTQNLLAYEREKSAVVFLSNSTSVGFGTATIQTSFAPGTKLIDLTGNATNPAIDPSNVMPDVVTVNASGQITLVVPHNGNAGTTTLNDNGYVIYGLATPRGTLSVSNVSSVLAGVTPSGANNAAGRLTSMDVITANSFNVTLDTIPVVLPDSTIDAPAGGNRAYLKINGGVDLNGNGTVDFVNPAGTQYGFENFVTKNSPLFTGGDGQFIQSIDATNLPEGPNYIEARAYRQRSDGGQDVFTSFRKVIYLDRLPPEVVFDSAGTYSGGGSNDRQIRVRSTDKTANNAHLFLNLPASVGTATIVGSLSAANDAVELDRDLFSLNFTNLPSGNHVITSVTFEPTGNRGIQRIPGIFIQTNRGRGIGDANWNNSFDSADISGAQGVVVHVFPNFAGQTNTLFNPAVDADANGLMDTRDLLAMRGIYIAGGATTAVINEMRAWELRRGNIDQSGAGSLTAGDATDIDHLYTRFGQTSNIWWPDLNVDAAVDQADVDVLVRQIFLTEYGDANLDRSVNISDFSLLASNFNQPGGWAAGNFDGQGGVSLGDFALLASNYNFTSSGQLPRAIVPEPAGLGAAVAWIWCSRTRRRIAPVSGAMAESSPRPRLLPVR